MRVQTRLTQYLLDRGHKPTALRIDNQFPEALRISLCQTASLYVNVVELVVGCGCADVQNFLATVAASL